MNVEFIRFKASDEVELQGWLSNSDSDVAAIHIHGMSGNGYENYFLDNMREMYASQRISFFAIDTRGRGIISDFRQRDEWKHAGSCFEIFEESQYDIQGAIDYLKSIGKSKFILQGHSLGCTKVVNYIINANSEEIIKVILLAPTDMVGWAKTDQNNSSYITKAHDLIANDKGEELVSAECWIDKTPISAQTYITICEKGSAADIYGNSEGGAFLGRVSQPMLIIYGDNDIGITQIDGSIDAWKARVDSIKNINTEISIIEGANHGFKGYEDRLSEVVERFVQ